MSRSRFHRSTLATLIGLSIAALALPGGAGAGVPQKSYKCYGEALIYLSTLRIKSSSKYNYLGKNGEYKYRKASKTLKFNSGPLKPWAGGRFRDSDGDVAIKLVTDKAGGQTLNCYQ